MKISINKDCKPISQNYQIYLKWLPKNDYPVLNSRLFVECWLAYVLDNSLTRKRDLFKRINPTGFEVDISTFSKLTLIEVKNHSERFMSN
jgi:hypothetical protein